MEIDGGKINFGILGRGSNELLFRESVDKKEFCDILANLLEKVKDVSITRRTTDY